VGRGVGDIGKDGDVGVIIAITTDREKQQKREEI